MRQDRNPETGVGRDKKRDQVTRPSRFALGRIRVGRVVLFLLFAGATYSLLIAGQAPLGVKQGEPSPRDFKARTRFLRMNIERTEAVRKQAGKAEPPVFRLVPEQWEEAAGQLLSAIPDGEGSSLWQGMPEGFDRDAVGKVMSSLREKRDQVARALESLSQQYVVSPEDLAHPVVQEKLTSQAVLRDPSGAERSVPISAFVVLDGEGSGFQDAFMESLQGLEPAGAALARRAFAVALRPSVALDVERSLESAELAARRQAPITEVVKQGSLILAQGSEVRSQHIDDLRGERDQYWASRDGRVVRVQRLAGLAVLLLIIMGGAVAYARRQRPELLSRRPQMLSFVLLTLALVATARLCVMRGISPLWVPLPLLVMIMCLVYDQRFGVGVALFGALLVRLACPGADLEFLVLFVGGAFAALLTGQVRTRSTLIMAGTMTGAVQFCAVWGLGLMAALNGAMVPLRFWESPLLAESLAALANGVLSGFVISGILPAIERLFGVTTDIRLLEWSDPNQPLLQRLLLDAPGSYHHSMIVGSLAADAAEAIGANPLLARVSAYFHDVGKLKKPEYFAENLPEGATNPHDELSPTMSSLIITAHPKDGAEMAEQFGVPREVRDIILQSHGSSVVKYFWGKAKDEEAQRGEMEEHSFRYRLPKPGSKEAAIIMLCDAVESTARSLKSPSVGQLRSLVRDTILDRLHDGQLDDSDLTIPDLKRLEDALVRGLAAVFHNRVSYPGQEKPQQEQQKGRKAGVPSGKTTEQDQRNAGGSVQQTERP